MTNSDSIKVVLGELKDKITDHNHKHRKKDRHLRINMSAVCRDALKEKYEEMQTLEVQGIK